MVERFLIQQDSESGLWPSDGDLAESLRSLPLYRLFKRDRLQRLLLAFEHHLTTDRTEPVPPSSKLSIEHLMPQSWHEHWPLPTDSAAEKEEERRDSLLHTIGNLTLVTGKLNSSLSNGPWDTKREHLLAHSALTLNRALPRKWTILQIEIRSEAFARAAIAMWPRPAEAATHAVLRITDADRDLTPDRDRAPTTAWNRSTSRPVISTRRDIGQHIVNAFASLEDGDFLTINEIRKVPSDQYPANDLPSPGAISARLFPGNGGRTTVPGVVGVIVDGRRGARKTR
ncbi:HNH endonuclease family protein [Nocardia xishanensis]